MNKKGIELAMNTIIISIILLVVMIVVLLIFTGVWKNADFVGFTKCDNRQGGDWKCEPDINNEGLFCLPGGGCEKDYSCCRPNEADQP